MDASSTILRSIGASAALLLACASLHAETETELTGHTKFRLLGNTYPADSLFRDLAGSDALDIEADLRLDGAIDSRNWSLDIAYQLLGVHGDTIEWTREAGDLAGLPGQRVPGDERRWWDLTHVIRDSGQSALVHRLDRLTLSHTTEKTVVRFGRQALSWGNGLFYAPLDLVNPFDPAAIDTEFKTGDDLLYGQYLRDNGDDLQAALVIRRNTLTGDVDSDQQTIALKYHGFAGSTEFDLLVADSYTDTVVGAGLARSVGGAIVRGDVVVTDTADDRYTQVVANLSYSWVAWDRNMSGALEYYFNGFGQRDGEYAPVELLANPDLTTRLARRELYALGRHYLAGSVLVEMSPLLSVTPTFLVNTGDPSALFQLVTQYSLADNTTLLGSLNVPIGSNGTEFGGIPAGLPDRWFATDLALFAQLAWYF